MIKSKKIELTILVVMLLMSFIYPTFLSKYKDADMFRNLLALFL